MSMIVFIDLFLHFKVELNCWLLIYSQIDEERASIYVKILRNVGSEQGMVIKEPIHVKIDNDETETYAHALRTNLNDQVNYHLYFIQ